MGGETLASFYKSEEGAHSMYSLHALPDSSKSNTLHAEGLTHGSDNCMVLGASSPNTALLGMAPKPSLKKKKRLTVAQDSYFHIVFMNEGVDGGERQSLLTLAASRNRNVDISEL